MTSRGKIGTSIQIVRSHVQQIHFALSFSTFATSLLCVIRPYISLVRLVFDCHTTGSSCSTSWYGSSCSVQCTQQVCNGTTTSPACNVDGTCACDTTHRGDGFCGSCTLSCYPAPTTADRGCTKQCNTTICNNRAQSASPCDASGNCQCASSILSP